MADLVLLEADLIEKSQNAGRIAAVVLKGRFLDREALDQMLRGVWPHCNRAGEIRSAP